MWAPNFVTSNNDFQVKGTNSFSTLKNLGIVPVNSSWVIYQYFSISFRQQKKSKDTSIRSDDENYIYLL